MWISDHHSDREQQKKKKKPEPHVNKISFEEHLLKRYQEEKQKLDQELKGLKEEKEKNEKYLQTIVHNPSRGCIRAKILLQKDIQEAQTRIQEIESGQELQHFEKQVEPYIEAFAREKQIRSIQELQNRVPNHLQETPHQNPVESQVLQEFQFDVDHQILERKYMPHDLCEECDSPMELEPRSSMLLCPMCGSSRQFLDATSSHMAYGDDVEFTSVSYMRLNHFNELLVYAQALETTQIPQEKVLKVAERLVQMGLKNPDQITLDHTHEAMKYLRMNEHYKQNTQMWCRITGKPPLRMDPDHVEKLKVMFKTVSRLWAKYKPADRKNILSYGVLLYRFNELLGYTKYCSLFRVLKGTKKLNAQSNIFQQICQDPELNWVF